MEPVVTFSGPLKPLNITDWLARCNRHFEEADQPIQDKRKIHLTGNAILQSADTANLYEWWSRNHTELEKKTWNEFQDAVKDKALGKTWRTEALKAFYTAATHGSETVDEYSKILEDNKYILEESKTFSMNIDNSVYKYHLLFNAFPERTSKVLKHDAYNDTRLITADLDDVKVWLRNYDDQPHLPGLPGPADSSVIYSGLSGYYASPSTMTSLAFPPGPTNALGHLSSVTLGVSSNVIGTRLTGLQLVLANPSSDFRTNIDTISAFGDTRNYEIGEYITSVKIYYASFTYYVNASSGTTIQAVAGMELSSSNSNKTLIRGNTTSYNNQAEFKAPSGWRIVGFYGRWDRPADYRAGSLEVAFFTQLGVIFARV
ncbi:hypothetical protein ETB97_005304 [Aspergillus alliaceus]|uniref:Uncharacterized protein n=1 Tax=Petromyces alliaceus TaxID=209559 RepID=A0A8H6AFK0_PETAA|nr:hypothetical protein ETB97_005304 [Aspergillus burnettii]